MARIARDLTWLVGRTPLLRLDRFHPEGPARLLAKLEALNPTSSNKDRAALWMIEHAERSGFLAPGTTVVECSAGDFGVSLAMVCAVRGYRLVLTMPDCAASSRRNLLRALGAEVVLTPAEHGIRAALEKAEELSRTIRPSLVLQPFSNRANAAAHAATTAREIWEDSDGEVDVVVCPVGSGGTAAGCLEFFRETSPEVRIVAVEPADCAVLAGKEPGPHDIPGIGAGFVPEILCPADLHEVIPVEEEDAYRAARELAAREGALVGPASGAVAWAARRIASRRDMAGRTVVAIFPDPGERYEDHATFAAELGR